MKNKNMKKIRIKESELYYYLTMYDQLDELIEEREKDIIETGRITYSSWMNGLDSIEDRVIKIDEDPTIIYYKKIESKIKRLLKNLKNVSPILFKYLYLRYHKECNDKVISKILGSEYDLKKLDNEVKKYISENIEWGAM